MFGPACRLHRPKGAKLRDLEVKHLDLHSIGVPGPFQGPFFSGNQQKAPRETDPVFENNDD